MEMLCIKKYSDVWMQCLDDNLFNEGCWQGCRAGWKGVRAIFDGCWKNTLRASRAIEDCPFLKILYKPLGQSRKWISYRISQCMHKVCIIQCLFLSMLNMEWNEKATAKIKRKKVVNNFIVNCKLSTSLRIFWDGCTGPCCRWRERHMRGCMWWRVWGEKMSVIDML